MKITDYNGGRDQFGRKFPVRIELREGKVIYGHIMAGQVGEQSKGIRFKVIKNIDNWANNSSSEHSEIIEFDDDVIKEIFLYNDY